MDFVVTHRYGRMERTTDLSCLDGLLAELDETDEEHGDVAVTQDGRWVLSVFSSGTVVWEDVEDNAPRHLKGALRSEALRLLMLVASGLQSELENEAWINGYR